jgi:hypothetical protein
LFFVIQFPQEVGQASDDAGTFTDLYNGNGGRNENEDAVQVWFSGIGVNNSLKSWERPEGDVSERYML